MPSQNFPWLGVIACAANMQLLLFNRGFTPSYVNALSSADPEVWGEFGQAMVVLWGLCYFAADLDFQNSISLNAKNSAWIWAVFAVEKIVYAARWFKKGGTALGAFAALQGAMANPTPANMFTPAVFHACYGLMDTIFVVVFLARFLKQFTKYDV